MISGIQNNKGSLCIQKEKKQSCNRTADKMPITNLIQHSHMSTMDLK